MCQWIDRALLRWIWDCFCAWLKTKGEKFLTPDPDDAKDRYFQPEPLPNDPIARTTRQNSSGKNAGGPLS